MTGALLHGDLPSPEKVETTETPFDYQLRAIARDYQKTFTLIDPNARWAPVRCAAPRPTDRVMGQMSVSKDTDTHGQKLYLLYARQSKAYIDLTEKGSPLDQMLVKESWQVEEVEKDERPIGDKTPLARKGKRLFLGKARGDLFIMFKLDPKTPQTDNGWVYGTVTADGKQVTSAGRVESCIGCHTRAKYDRLFGLEREAKETKKN
jgi:hypothetical protein